jgi:hypothetical protein
MKSRWAILRTWISAYSQKENDIGINTIRLRFQADDKHHTSTTQAKKITSTMQKDRKHHVFTAAVTELVVDWICSYTIQSSTQ